MTGADPVVQILLRARNETKKQLDQATKDLKAYEKQAKSSSDTMRRGFTLSTTMARAALAGLGTGLALGVAALWRFERALEAGSVTVAGMAGMTKEGATTIREEMRTLFGSNDNPLQDSIEALGQLETAFRIFDISDREGLAQLLIDWKDATGQNMDAAGANFRRLVLAYFGPNADVSRVLPGLADKIFAVATAVGVDPGGLADAFAQASPVLREAFPTLEEGLGFLATLAAVGGKTTGAAAAIRTFSRALTEARKAIAEGQFENERLDVFRVLGLTPETIANEGFSIGELMMMALRNGMADGVLTPEELRAFGVLFSEEVGTDMALAASAVEDFAARAETALGDDGYAGSVARASALTDDTFGGRLTRSWNELTATVTATGPWQALQDAVISAIDYLRSLMSGEWADAADSGFDFGVAFMRLLGNGSEADLLLRLREWWETNFMPAWATWWEGIRTGDWMQAAEGGLDIVRSLGIWTPQDFADWWDGSIVPGFEAWASGNPFVQMGASLWGGIKNEWRTAMGGAWDFWAGIWSDIMQPALLGELRLNEVGPLLWARMRDAWTQAINGNEGIIPWAVNRWVTFRDAFTAWTNNAPSIGWSMWDNFIMGLEQTWGEVTAWVENQWADLRAGFDTWIANARTVGSDLIGGLMGGLGDGWQALRDAERRNIEGFVDFWKGLLGIRSPSTVFREIGSWLMQGFREGMEDEENTTLRDAEDFARRVTDIFRRNGEALRGLFNGTYKPMWGQMVTDAVDALGELGVNVNDTTRALLGTWAGYADQFMGLLDKHNGNVLKAFADLLLSLAQQKLIELAIVQAVEIGKAFIQAPLTFGATLASLGPIALAYAGAAAAIGALRSQILGSLAVGSDYVPATGAYQLHEGEAVLTRTEAQAYRAGSASDGGDITVQVVLDGAVITEQVSRRLYGNVRQFVKADLRYAR